MQNPSESIDSVLAKNLVVARVVSGVTQHELAGRAGISRATIAQIETGCSDPRLSTIAELAKALGIPLIVLLTGAEEVRALTGLCGNVAPPEPSIGIPQSEVDRMLRLIRSGMLKDRLRAARIGAALARAAGRESPNVQVCSAIFSAVLPGAGTIAGTLLGELLLEAEYSQATAP